VKDVCDQLSHKKGNSLEINRRHFMAISATTAAAISIPGLIFAEATEAQRLPWHQKIRRAGQVNITEHDPAVLNVEEWADYWASLKCDVVFASVTGIIAFYPTSVPFHRRSKYLNGRDFTGELVAAAKKRKMRAIARFSPDLNWADALEAHPEWFRRNKQGNPFPGAEEPTLYNTCMFTTYMTEHMPAIMREVNSRYEIDGLFTNAWPTLGAMPECYCNACKDLPHFDTPAYWEKYTERVVYLWKMWDGIAKERGSDNLFFANMGEAIRSGPNMIDLKAVAQWYNCDNQGRGGEEEAIWGCTLQGRVCNAIMDGHTATGMVPWYHFVGGEEGLGADRRWHEPGREYFDWLAKHDQHLTNRNAVANIAVVMGQRTQRFYRHEELGDPMMNIHGIYMALLEGRFLFDFLHEQDLTTDKIRKYKTTLLPNIALLSDAECEALKSFSQGGGSIMASFETSLYDEKNKRRTDFGFADIFGIHSTGERRTRVGNIYGTDRAQASDSRWLHRYRLAARCAVAPAETQSTTPS
jgi:hypothetical protein